MGIKQKSVTLTQSWTKHHSAILKKYRVVITSAPIGNIEYKIIKNAVTHKNVSIKNLEFKIKGVNQICNEIFKTANPLYVKLSHPPLTTSLRRLSQIKL